jgi:curved DNA-binding protein
MALAYKDYYEELGVPRDAEQDAIRRSYRKLARKLHPDLNSDSDAEDRFKELGEAYEVLSDPDKRERYDRLGANWRQQEREAPDASFEEFFARQGFGSDDTGMQFGDDLFERLFGGRAAGGAGGWTTGPLRGQDREALLELSLEDALEHFRRRGEHDLDVDLPVAPWQAALGATVSVRTPSGTAQVRVPAGSSSGRRLRLRGRGLSKSGGGSGDLHAIVKITVPKQLSDRERELYEQLAESSPRETTA